MLILKKYENLLRISRFLAYYHLSGRIGIRSSEKFFKLDNAGSLNQAEINRVNKIGDKPK